MKPFFTLIACAAWCALAGVNAPAASLQDVSRLINDGHWKQAQREIDQALAQPNVDFRAREAWLFERDRMARIRVDFHKTREQILREARAIVPSLTDEMFTRCEKAGALEFVEIDGERWFYDRAAGNMFRIDPEARALKKGAGVAVTKPYRLEDVRRILAAYDNTAERFNTPRTSRITYTLNVKPGVVPSGEMVRAWLPFPHSGARQKDIRLISTDPARYVQTGTTGTLTSVYLEKPALANEATRFQVCFEYTTTADYQPIAPEKVRPVSTSDASLAPYLAEQPPHVVFTDEIRKLSEEIVGDETNPYRKARRLFQWVYEHIPWTGAREYSTLDSLPHYALSCRHGDCGIQTTLFMTLCRLNGIPAHWETGWTTGPDKNMHDWCSIYLAPYGWVPADVSYGLVNSEQEREKWFYLGGIDCHRLVVNTDQTQPLYPAKTVFRSEIIDFQRGEVEWRGGNLYFNQWDWDFRVDEVTTKP